MRRIFLPFMAGIIFWGFTSIASDEVPLKIQAPILLKVLSYDRNLTERLEGDAVLFGLVVKSKKSGEDIAKYFKAYEGKTLQMKPLQIEVVMFKDKNSFQNTLQQKRFAAVYIENSFSQGQLKDILDVATMLKTPVFCGVEEYVKLGASVGLKIKDNRPKIVVNLNASRVQGMDLPAKLLKLSEIVK